MARSNTVESLAARSGFDVEDVIIELVRMGLQYAVDPKAIIRRDDERSAMYALGLHPESDERKKSFWCAELGLTSDELENLLLALNVQPNSRASNLPKGAHLKLQRHSQAAGRTMVTAPASPSALRTENRVLPVAPSVVWRTVGQKRVSQLLEAKEVEYIHEELELDAEQASDPISPPGVKSYDLLESACLRPHTGISSNDAKYPTVEMAAAALVHSLVNNHPFFNGNKRTALVSMMVLLDKNNHWLRDTVKQADLYIWILEVARHRVLDENFAYIDRADREVLAMADWIRRNSRAIERSERPINWRQLRAILTNEFACTIEPKAYSGKFLIKRSVRVTSKNPLRGFKKEVEKAFTFTPGGDGKEIGLGTIKTLRKELCLTEDFNIDSSIFYGTTASPDHFIAKYQRVLRDLARV